MTLQEHPMVSLVSHISERLVGRNQRGEGQSSNDHSEYHLSVLHVVIFFLCLFMKDINTDTFKALFLSEVLRNTVMLLICQLSPDSHWTIQSAVKWDRCS